MAGGSIRLFGGKAEFLKVNAPTGIESICLCEYNADLADGCMAQVRGDKVEEVIANNGKYASKENFVKYLKQGITNHRCTYCYAKRYNGGRTTPKKVDKNTRKDFEEIKPKFVRLGKRTEGGHYFYQDNLFEFLDLCEEYKTKAIFPTKMLPFDEKMAELLESTGSVVNYSICSDKAETGCASQRYSNNWRIEQAKLYSWAGVNTTLTVTCDVTSPIWENSKQGFSIIQVLKASEEEDLTLRLLPLRIPSKSVANHLLGRQWENILYREKDIVKNILPNMESEISRANREVEAKPYVRRGNNELMPRFFHPDFQQLVDSGIGVCGQVGELEYCDKCNLKEDTRLVIPVSEFIPIVYDKSMKMRNKKMRKKKEKPRNTKQKVLFEL